MSPEMVGIIGIFLMFVFMFIGMPIGFCMAVTGVLGQIFLFGWDGAINQLGMVPYATVSSFALCVIPLFMLMGDLAFSSGITDSAYNWIYKVVGRMRGGLAMTVIGACGVFAACTGSSIASAVTMTRVSLPKMHERKYDDGMATGAIAAGGTLGILIPPSAPMILYSILTDASIGKMFIAGIIPGIVLIMLFMITVYIQVSIKPAMGPAGEQYSFREIIGSIQEMWAPTVLFGVVLSGLWLGVFSPSEAGGVGAFIALVINIIKRKDKSWKDILIALNSAMQSTAMIFIIIIGAMIFGDFMTISNLPALLVKFIDFLDFPPLMIIFILMVMYVILGALMDELAIMLITVPVILPSLVHMNVDLIWFGILFVVNQQMGLILPPVGMIVFVLAGITTVPMYTIYRGVLPFALAMFVLILLVMFFPELCLWLPNLMLK